MKDGVIQQIDTPLELYDNPANLFVAGFIGTPPTNFFDGHLENDGERIVFTNDALRIPLPVERKVAEYVNRDVVLGIRPEHLGSDEAEHDPASPRIHAKISVVEPMGAETYLYLDVTRTNSCIARVNAHRRLKVGDEIDMGIHINSIHLFDKITSNRI